MWYLLVTPVVSSGFPCGIFLLSCGLFWLPMWYPQTFLNIVFLNCIK
jgi:hypothetical protein